MNDLNCPTCGRDNTMQYKALDLSQSQFLLHQVEYSFRYEPMMLTSRLIALVAAYRGDHNLRPRVRGENDCCCTICDETRLLMQQYVKERHVHVIVSEEALTRRT